MKNYLESIKETIKRIISFMLNSVKNNNNFEQLITYFNNNLKVSLLKSDRNYELKKSLYHEIIIDTNNIKSYVPIKHCKTLSDVIFAYKIYNTIDKIVLTKYDNLFGQKQYSKFEYEKIYVINNDLTNNTKQILNDIIQDINNKYNTTYELYTGISSVSNDFPMINLYISEKNYYNLIDNIKAILRTCNVPLTLEENKKFIKLYANKPYYSSAYSHFPKLCESIYDLIIVYFLNTVITKLSTNNNIIIPITLIEFPNNTNKIIEHLKPIIQEIFTGGNYNKKYSWKIQDNKLVIMRKKMINNNQLIENKTNGINNINYNIINQTISGKEDDMENDEKQENRSISEIKKIDSNDIQDNSLNSTIQEIIRQIN